MLLGVSLSLANLGRDATDKTSEQQAQARDDVISRGAERIAIVTGSKAGQRCLRNDSLKCDVDEANEVGAVLHQSGAEPLLPGQGCKRRPRGDNCSESHNR